VCSSDLIQPAGSALGAGMQRNATFSADFDNIPISAALSELSRMSRIRIVTSTPAEGRIKKSFRNESIDGIIRELLNGFNYASLWSVKEDGVESITIWVFEKSIGPAPDRNLPPIEPNPPSSTIPPPPIGLPQIPGTPIRPRADESSARDADTTSDREPDSSEGEGNMPEKEISEAEREGGKDSDKETARGKAPQKEGKPAAEKGESSDPEPSGDRTYRMKFLK